MNVVLMYFYNLIDISGGAERVLCNMANEFIERGHDITIICCDPNKGMPFYQLNNKVELINLNGTGKDFKAPLSIKIEREIKRLLGNVNTEEYKIRGKYNNILSKLNKILNEIKPDVVISYEQYSLTVLKSLLNNSVPTIAMLHLDANQIFKNNMSVLEKDAYNKADCIQVLINSNINVVRKFCKNVKIINIPNIVNMPEIKTDNNNKKIISVGRITKNHKRQHLLLETYNKIKEEFSEWTIEIVGGTWLESDKKYKEELIKYLEDNEMNEKVVFAGSIKNVDEHLAKADIFAFPSAYEGFGLALTEAMAAGLPAIGYKSCPSVNELIIDGYNGFLCEDGIDDFAEKLKILMSDAELRKKMGQNARESMKQFAPEKIWDQWETLINEVVAEHKKQS